MSSFEFSEFSGAAAHLPPPDWVLFACKVQRTAFALEVTAPLVPIDASVACCQNSLAVEELGRVFGAERTVGVMINWSADLIAPGHVRYGGPGTNHYGELTGDSPRSRTLGLAAALKSIARPEFTCNIVGLLWSKVCYSMFLIGSVLVDAPLWQVAANPAASSVIEMAIAEAVRIARAKEVVLEQYGYFDPSRWLIHGLSPDDSIAFWASCEERYRTQVKQYSGVWMDVVVKRRPSEGLHQLRFLTRLADSLGEAAPVLKGMTLRLHEIEAGHRAMCWSNFAGLSSAI